MIAAAAIFFTSSAVNFDASSMNVLLADLSRAFAVAPARAVGLVSAYQIALMIAVLPFSALGERFGLRKLYICGLTLIATGAAFSGLAGSFEILMVARVLTGLGAACAMGASAGVIRRAFGLQGIGFGLSIIAVAAGTSSALGPIAAGALLTHFDWRWTFAVTAPFCVIAFMLVRAAVPKDGSPSESAFDWRSLLLYGAVAAAIAITALTATAIPIAAMVSGVAAASLGIWLLRRQARATAPLLPVDLLRLPVFALSLSTSSIGFAAMMIALVTLPFYLAEALSFEPLLMGAAIAAWPIAGACAAPIAGRIADKGGALLVSGIGLALSATAMTVLALLATPSLTALVFVTIAACGAGFGSFQTANNRLLIAAAPEERIGAAGGVIVIARLIGQGLGASGAAWAFAALGERQPLFIASTAFTAALLIGLARLRFKGAR